jgi:hypothetical protein
LKFQVEFQFVFAADLMIYFLFLDSVSMWYSESGFWYRWCRSLCQRLDCILWFGYNRSWNCCHWIDFQTSQSSSLIMQIFLFSMIESMTLFWLWLFWIDWLMHSFCFVQNRNQWMSQPTCECHSSIIWIFDGTEQTFREFSYFQYPILTSWKCK